MYLPCHFCHYVPQLRVAAMATWHSSLVYKKRYSIYRDSPLIATKDDKVYESEEEEKSPTRSRWVVSSLFAIYGSRRKDILLFRMVEGSHHNYNLSLVNYSYLWNRFFNSQTNRATSYICKDYRRVGGYG